MQNASEGGRWNKECTYWLNVCVALEGALYKASAEVNLRLAHMRYASDCFQHEIASQRVLFVAHAEELSSASAVATLSCR